MKKLILTLVSVVLLSGQLAAGWLEDLTDYAENELEPVVSDIGAVIGTGQIGSSLSFPGLEAGIKLNTAEITDTELIDTEMDQLIIPAVSAGAALPAGISLNARGMAFELPETSNSMTWVGASGKYSVIKDKTISPLPGISALAGYNIFTVKDIITVSNLSVGAVVEKSLPLVTPYAGLAYDINKGKIETDLGDIEPESNFIRYEAGVSLKL
ncbi:MAG: hypothetical protein U9R36_06455, partial [Elusimicrobiota bacterium]|nr:hypothetical protein [Elusimicrobiota bacterium]